MPASAGRDEDPMRRARPSPATVAERRRPAPTRSPTSTAGSNVPAALAVERRRRRRRAGSSGCPTGSSPTRASTRQRALRAVEDRARAGRGRARPRSGSPRVEHRLAGGQARRVLVDLDHGVRRRRGGSPRPARPACADVDDVVEARRRQAPRDDDRAGDAVDLTDRRRGRAVSIAVSVTSCLLLGRR